MKGPHNNLLINHVRAVLRAVTTQLLLHHFWSAGGEQDSPSFPQTMSVPLRIQSEVLYLSTNYFKSGTFHLVVVQSGKLLFSIIYRTVLKYLQL